MCYVYMYAPIYIYICIYVYTHVWYCDICVLCVCYTWKWYVSEWYARTLYLYAHNTIMCAIIIYMVPTQSTRHLWFDCLRVFFYSAEYYIYDCLSRFSKGLMIKYVWVIGRSTRHVHRTNFRVCIAAPTYHSGSFKTNSPHTYYNNKPVVNSTIRADITVTSWHWLRF